jgi:hypothetical protein
MKPELLNVVTVISNPQRWKSRINLFKDFRQHMIDTGVNLTVVEAAYGDIPHVLADLDPHPRVTHIKKWCNGLNWIKENLQNIGVHHTNPQAQYLAFLDADIKFRNPNWAKELVYTLQHFHVVQPWSTAYDLGPQGQHLGLHRSFAWVNHTNPEAIGKQGPYIFGHPGYGMAMTRKAFDWLGGLPETAAFGAGDHHFWLSMVNKAHLSFPAGIHPNYKKPILALQERANKFISGAIHYLDVTIEHSFHGAKKDRKYIDRWQIPVKHGFDPENDLKRNSHGVLEFAGNKPALERDMWKYLFQRNEDATTL